MRKLIILFIIFSFILFAEETPKQKDVKIEDTEIKTILEKLNQLEKRVSNLEKKIDIIQGQIKELRNIIRDLQIYVGVPQKIIKPEENDWQQVKNGMTKEDVSKILGSPNLIQPNVNKIEIWLYYELGRIFFNQDGRVIKKELDKNLTPETIFR